MLPAGLVVDHKDNRLYWVNTESNTIQFYDFVLLIVKDMPLTGPASPTAAVVYNNTLYYADQADSAIHAVDKGDGANHYIVRNNTGLYPQLYLPFIRRIAEVTSGLKDLGGPHIGTTLTVRLT